ncbi:MAG TPA: DUF3298 domain-containing protein [Rhizomicrobium sp.]|nr:DUF3298 domain-containing protein [Rhizomicrobium sp.]
MRIGHITALMIMGAPSAAFAAPSFDCAKAASIAEKAICSDTTLSQLDQKLAASYSSALSRLSVPAQAQVRDGQRQWLKYVGTICGRANPPKKDSRAKPPAKCLLDEYEERQKQLNSAVTVQDGRAFYYAQSFKAHRSPEADDFYGYKSGFVIWNVSYPQQDNPKTPQDKLLNAKLAADAKASAGNFPADSSDDITLDIKLSAVHPALISFEGVSGSYGHGAAHGQYASFSLHWLVREGRELKAADIFSAQTKWQDFLRDTCFAGVKHFGFVKAPKDLGNTPQEPFAWNLGKNGLTVFFSPYEVASYADGEPEVTISWDKLKPYLAKTAPAILEGIN